MMKITFRNGGWLLVLSEPVTTAPSTAEFPARSAPEFKVPLEPELVAPICESGVHAVVPVTFFICVVLGSIVIRAWPSGEPPKSACLCCAMLWVCGLLSDPPVVPGGLECLGNLPFMFGVLNVVEPSPAP